jgi:aromatic ring-opening dioxygenase catalytic subunit (LigB family)
MVPKRSAPYKEETAQRSGDTKQNAVPSRLPRRRIYALKPLINYRAEAPHAVRAHPTEEHFLPLLVALGARQEGDVLQMLDGGGVIHGMLSMESYVWGPPG